MIAANEDDSAAFMITDTTEITGDRDSSSMVLFSPTEVLLDNRPGRYIFTNSSLSNVSNVIPVGYYEILSRVDKSR